MLAGLLARCRFPASGARLTCAVSGGPDSLALLALACAAGLEVTAVHVDHGLRPGSAAEADVVAAAASRFGAAFRAERVQVAPGPNLEARARAARYGVLPAGVATGHTADDRAETIVLNLLRGAGADGVAVLPPGPRHPIVTLRRSETVGLCTELGLEPVVDPTNVDPRFRRNRVRAEVLPLLSEVAGRDVVPLLCRHGEVVGSLAAFVAELAGDLDVTAAAALAAAPHEVAAAAVRSWLRSDDEESHPPDRATVERVLSVARGEVVATEVGRGRRVRRSAGRLVLEVPSGGAGQGTPRRVDAEEYP